MNFNDLKETFYWTALGQVYGILSRFAFIVDKSDYIDTKYMKAFQDAEDSLRDDELDLDAFELLIEAIKVYRGAEYKLDLLNEYDEIENDEEDYDEDDECCNYDECSECSYEENPNIRILSNMDKDTIKRIVKEIAKVVDEVANED